MSANRCVTARLRATDRPSSAGSNWFSVRWSSELPKNCMSHIDASHSRQPLVKGDRVVRYEVKLLVSHETSKQRSPLPAKTTRSTAKRSPRENSLIRKLASFQLAPFRKDASDWILRGIILCQKLVIPVEESKVKKIDSNRLFHSWPNIVTPVGCAATGLVRCQRNT